LRLIINKTIKKIILKINVVDQDLGRSLVIYKTYLYNGKLLETHYCTENEKNVN